MIHCQSMGGYVNRTDISSFSKSTFTFKIFSAILIVFAIVSCAAQHFITNITIFNGLRNNEKKYSSKTDLLINRLVPMPHETD
ncbi:hypothetical protein BpHYR1_046157 [Brachionus plicatilis]|uniref:Uncharacterized protein n=1 Tax=Brachionus plicatilis TaxID=10195 RepID=A0A3M7QJ09_BRAPC|nr:hypothetical protein BpHYR1_046157 [Brachionus plicatilis]